MNHEFTILPVTHFPQFTSIIRDCQSDGESREINLCDHSCSLTLDTAPRHERDKRSKSQNDSLKEALLSCRVVHHQCIALGPIQRCSLETLLHS